MTSRTCPLFLATSACLVGFGGSLCHAQWSDDAALNTPLITAAGEQAQPKIARTADGGAYISWFDNRTGGYDVYLQRIDADGQPQWQADGILVADRSFSSTQDYDLDVDADGYAVLAFRDDRLGGIVVTANRVAPDGTLAWGSAGVQPSLTGSFVGAIQVAATSDGHSVVGWYNGEAARVVKLDSGGNELWATDIGSAPIGSFTVSDLVASDEAKSIGQVAVVMTTMGAFFQPRHLYVQKLGADGSTLWTDPTPIFTLSSIQIGYFPSALSDGAGGIVMAWYQTDPLQVRAQHVDADGVIQFPADGAVVSTNAAQARVSPSAAYDASTGETYVFWSELTSVQSPIGVYGQKFNASGQRQWADEGRRVLETANECSQVLALPSDEGAQVYFAERLSPTSQRLLGGNVDDQGDLVWAGDLVDVSTADSEKSRLTAVLGDGQAMLVWQDSRNDFSDLFIQNVNADGSLGSTGSSPIGDLNDDGVVDVSDLLLLLSAWGTCDGGCDADLNGDMNVDVSDLLMLLANWG